MNAPAHWAIWIPVIVLVTIVVVTCLIDIARGSRVKHLPKAAWALIVVLVNPSWSGGLPGPGAGQGNNAE